MGRKLGYRFGRARVREAATSLLRQAPAVLKLLGRLMTDARVSGVDRALVGAVIAYVISPWDLIPDFLSIIGVVDDLFLIGITLDRLVMRAPAQVIEEHWEGTPEGLDALTAELTAIGEALPNTLRSILHGRVSGDAWGADFDGPEVYEAEQGEDATWAPAERAARGRRPRGREVGMQDFDDAPDDDEAVNGEERVDGYRSRL